MLQTERATVALRAQFHKTLLQTDTMERERKRQRGKERKKERKREREAKKERKKERRNEREREREKDRGRGNEELLGTRTVSDLIRVGGQSYDLGEGNCHFAAERIMKLP
ncbi:hypothetical protein INR49_007973 [Caranx melampygus]|nr:hypothetical protein INR49_007973 [Caranx melampygus]